MRRLTLAERRQAKDDIEAFGEYDRPRTRADCEAGPRPCPFVGCRYHLYLDVLQTGNIKLNFPLTPLEGLPETCVLDVAERGPQNLEQVGYLMNLTRERVRQIEQQAVRHVRRTGAVAVLRELRGQPAPVDEEDFALPSFFRMAWGFG